MYTLYMKAWAWDYDLADNWQPKTDMEWAWYLVRKINYNDLTGLTPDILREHLPDLTTELDPGKRILLTYYLTGHTP